MRNLKKTVVAPALAAMLLLGACATEEHGKATDSAPKGSNADVSDSATPTGDSSKDSGGSSDTAKFGQTYTFENGLAVTVSAPKRFKPSEYAAGADKKGVPVMFTVTAVNGTKEPVEVSMFYSTVQSGDQEAESIFDSETGLEGTPSTKVLPGRQSKWKEGFMVKNPKDLVYDLAPGFEFDDAIWTNAS